MESSQCKRYLRGFPPRSPRASWITPGDIYPWQAILVTFFSHKSTREFTASARVAPRRRAVRSSELANYRSRARADKKVNDSFRAQRSSVYLFLALAGKSFLRLNSSGAPRRDKQDLRDAVPAEKISGAGRQVSGSFLRTLFRYPLARSAVLPTNPPPLPLAFPSDRVAFARSSRANARKAGKRMMVVGREIRRVRLSSE